MKKFIKGSNYISNAKVGLDGVDFDKYHISIFDPTCAAAELAELANSFGFEGSAVDFIFSTNIDWDLFEETYHQYKHNCRRREKNDRKLDKGKLKNFKITKECNFCEKKFLPHKGYEVEQNHCSYACANADRKKRTDEKLESLKKECKFCGKPFIPKRHHYNQIYCSYKCGRMTEGRSIEYNGIQYRTIKDLAVAFNLKPNTVVYRIRNGWSIDEIVGGLRSSGQGKGLPQRKKRKRETLAILSR